MIGTLCDVITSAADKVSYSKYQNKDCFTANSKEIKYPINKKRVAHAVSENHQTRSNKKCFKTQMCQRCLKEIQNT